VGFRRKIIEILPNMLLSWAGNPEEAKELARDIRLYFGHVEINTQNLQNFAAANESKFPNLQAILLVTLGSNGWFCRFNIPMSNVGVSPVFNRFAVAGSGSEQFLNALREPVVPILYGEFQNDPICQVFGLYRHFMSAELKTLTSPKLSDITTLINNFGGAFEVYRRAPSGKMKRINHIMYLRYNFMICNGEISEFTQYPYVYRQWYFKTFLITQSIPLQNYDDSSRRGYIIPDILFDENTDPWPRRIAPPRVPPYLVCVETIIQVGERLRGVNIVCEGDYVNRIVDVFRQDDLVRIRPTPNFLDHVRTLAMPL
jgi:hypothetical protein